MDIGRVGESYFNLPNEYSSSIILTDSDFILTNRTCVIAITAEKSFKTALAADFSREYKNRIPMEAKTRNRRRSSLASGGVADTGKVSMLLGDAGDGEAARGPRKPSLVIDETERLPCGEGSEGTLASSVRPEPRTISSTGAVCTDTRNLF